MNIFGFDYIQALVGLMTFFVYGLFFGFVVLGLIRFLLFTAFERKEA